MFKLYPAKKDIKLTNAPKKCNFFHHLFLTGQSQVTSCFLRLLEKGVLERLVNLLLVLVILTDLILSNLNSGVLKLSL